MIDRNDMKAAVKEALKEWLNERAAVVGWWSISMLAAAALAALVWLILAAHGWRVPQ